VGVLVFSHFLFNFYSEICWRVFQMSHRVGGVHSIQVACVTSFDGQNLIIHRLTGCAIISSFIWCDECRHVVVRLLLIVVFSFLFCSFLTTKVHHCPFCYLIFNFNSHSFNFLLRSYFLYRSFFFNLVLQLQFLICFVFHFSPFFYFLFHFFFSFSPYFFNFLFHSYSFLVSVLILSITYFILILFINVFFYLVLLFISFFFLDSFVKVFFL